MTKDFWSEARTAVSVVVPGMTAIFLPPRSCIADTLSALTSRLPPSTKIMWLKSTCSWRESVFVVEPHSRSTVPLTTEAIRVSGVTGTHFTSSFASLSCCWMPVAIRWQRSTE